MTMPSTVEPTLEELVSLLGRFPHAVLPAAVMQAIMARNEAANEVLLSRLNIGVENAGGGLGAIPAESFLCLALLHNSPDVSMLPTLKRLFELDEAASEEIVGALRHGFATSLIARMSNPETIDGLRPWIDEIVQNPKVDEYLAWNLTSVVTRWVNRDLITREAGIAQLKAWLEQRSSERYDSLSSGILIEMLTLKASEEHAFLEQCFERGQIDESIVGDKSVLLELDSDKSFTSEVDQRLLENDLIGYFSRWAGFPKLSRSLDPRETEYEEREFRFDRDSFRAQETDRWFAAIRKSNYENYPREAVDWVIQHASKLTARLVEEIRWGLSQADDPTPRASNGPFLAATLLAAQPPIDHTDVFLGILDMPVEQRENVFGDSIVPCVVAALANSLLGDCEPIDTRITDSSRDGLDRCDMAYFYPWSVSAGYLDRQECLDRLIRWLQQSLEEKSLDLSSGLYDALCLMSVGKDEPAMRLAQENGISNRYLSPEQAQQCIDEPSQASQVAWDFTGEFRMPRKAIENSGMFSREALESRPKRRETLRTRPKPMPSASMRKQTSEPPAQPIRPADERTPRNASCPCGSGKKYKKCCGKR